jgi:hypothetical protein
VAKRLAVVCARGTHEQDCGLCVESKRSVDGGQLRRGQHHPSLANGKSSRCFSHSLY